jgi:dihydrofolate reductase
VQPKLSCHLARHFKNRIAAYRQQKINLLGQSKMETPHNVLDDRSPKQSIAALVAISKNGTIGKDGELPWRLSSDLRRFKKITMGGVLVMGRKTYDSIGRPLPGRTTIVMTRDPTWRCEGVQSAGNPEDAISIAGNRPTFIVGGAEIYRQLLPLCDQVFLTRVLTEIEGDTHLELDLCNFEVVKQQDHPPTDRDEYPTEFIEYRRKKRS